MSFLCVSFINPFVVPVFGFFFCETQYLAMAPGITGSTALLRHFTLGRPLKYDCISLCLQLSETASALVCLQLCVAKRLQHFSCVLRAAGGTSQQDLTESTGLSGMLKQIYQVCDQVDDSRGQEILYLGSCALPTVFMSEQFGEVSKGKAPPEFQGCGRTLISSAVGALPPAQDMSVC